jgi:cholesterol oxidase
MGRDADHGVVDAFGQVFGFPGLVIADGSVMPGPVGANPSLTIAALADRFVERSIGTLQRAGTRGRPLMASLSMTGALAQDTAANLTKIPQS